MSEGCSHQPDYLASHIGGRTAIVQPQVERPNGQGGIWGRQSGFSAVAILHTPEARQGPRFSWGVDFYRGAGLQKKMAVKGLMRRAGRSVGADDSMYVYTAQSMYPL